MKFEKHFFCSLEHPPSGNYSPLSWVFYCLGAIHERKKLFFSNFSFSVRNTINCLKYHLVGHKRSIIDQNMKGVAENLSLPCPFEVQN